jgi:hypothetical protein
MRKPVRMHTRSLACAALAVLALGCGEILDYPSVGPEQSASSCGDGKDNDLDGKTDCADSECARYCVEDTQATCHDGVDNDQNAKTDCRDPACTAFCPESGMAACADREDNDLDGKTDCDDPDCDGFCPEDSQSTCNDERDNDGDGLSDGADPRCWVFAAPRVQRCAEASGVSLVENFDSGLGQGFGRGQLGSEWYSGYYSTHSGQSVGVNSFHQNGSREDGLIEFLNFYAPAETFNRKPGALVRQWAFSGSWKDFELSFSASVPPDTLLRAGVVPVDLAPAKDLPLPGAETALFALTLDAEQAPPSFALDVDGAHFSAPLPVARSLCAGVSVCGDDFSKVRVVLDDQGFHATLTRPSGQTVELRAPAPSSRALPPSRLVFWGGSGVVSTAALDDVRLNVAAERPCGVAAPQIPGPGCAFADELGAFGHAVSLARGNNGEYCALVTASADASAPNPEALTAWTSADGDSWTPASSLATPPVELPEGTTLVGAGIAHDDQGWHVAVAYHEQQNVRLGFASGTTCGAWGQLTPGPTLPPDAESPSYVIANGRHEVYFTRAPSGALSQPGQGPVPPGHNRTLWRTLRADPPGMGLEPEFLAELPASVGGPVSVQLIGAKDLVLVHPTAPGSGVAGVGFLVSDSDGRSWNSVEPSPLLALGKFENRGETRLAFDDLGVTSAALSWSQSGGFLLYGGSSALGWSGSTGYHPLLSVGTARMAQSSEAFPEASSGPTSSCGDGTCDAGEHCATCPADCPCTGMPLLSDVFTRDKPWEVVSSDPRPASVQYLDLDHSALNWAGGGSTWSVLPLDRAIVGDFELSFDLDFSWVDPPLPASFAVGSLPTVLLCSVFVGLGSVPDPVAEAGDAASTQAGVFARVTPSYCLGKYLVKPSALSAGRVFEDPPATPGRTGELVASMETPDTRVSCLGDRYWTVETRRNVVLRRVGNRLSVGVNRDDGCGMAERTVTYTGALPELPALLVGFGGGNLAGCDPSAGSGTITNLALRLLDDPSRCPATQELCGGGLQESTCVDTRLSPEHCGACGHACAANELCVAGTCVCSDSPGILSCDGACVDSFTDIDHCGACGQVCAASCIAGACQVVSPTGSCNAPLLLDPEGGSTTLDFSHSESDLTQICSVNVSNRLVLSFTPSVSGLATLELDVGTTTLDTVLGVTEATVCSDWPACNDDDDLFDLGYGSRVVLPVVAGTTYLIGAGLRSGEPLRETAELRIGIEP